ncbi:hypothetical protein PHISCL_04191 [Aspergillus sclerotialis]|uniref:Uncharacterized protein n=1 Tax=Aspergillus sclerotialis TaxID=2070753 RepID=A0A3A2ZJW9_9EURO|nr:hypothetical protein PHISCL_04191 [Aspergillus sclerotialis]
MRLRETIRAPSRFDCEDFYTPGSKRSLRNRIYASPSYIDFNPNLPPAAFPTLDRPRPSEKSNNGALGKENCAPYTKGAEQPDSKGTEPPNGQTGAGRNGGETSVEFADFSLDEIENQMASNGPLNKVYVSNMAIMAAIGEDQSEDLNMEDSDVEEASDAGSVAEEAHDPTDVPKDEPLKHNPRWNDLSHRMHVEIVGNLLEHHSFPAVCRMLGLSTEECEEVEGLFDNRNRQIALENRLLRTMREKQFRALIRIDYTTLKRNKIPYQLVLRRRSRDCSRFLSHRIKDDYQLCQYGDFMTARKFLHMRGIARSYAGDWSNTMVSLRAPEYDSEPDIFEWKEHVQPNPKPTSEGTPAAITTTPCPNPGNGANMKRMLGRLSFINNVGKAVATVNPRDLVKRKGNPFATPKWLIDDQQEFHKRKFEQLQEYNEEHNTPQRSGLVCLRIGTERAAQISNSDASYLNQDNVFYPAFALPRESRLPQFVRPDQIHQPAFVNRPYFPSPSPNRIQVASTPRWPVQRTLGGNWSYNSVEHGPKSHVTPAAIVRQKLEEAKLEAVKGKTVREYCDELNELRRAELEASIQQALLMSNETRTQDDEEALREEAEYQAFFDAVINLEDTPTKDEATKSAQPTPTTVKSTKAPQDQDSSDKEPEADDCDDEMILLPNGETCSQ